MSSPDSPAPRGADRSRSTRLRMFGGLCVVCIALIAVYAWKTAPPPVRNVTLPSISSDTNLAVPAAAAPPATPAPPATLEGAAPQPETGQQPVSPSSPAAAAVEPAAPSPAPSARPAFLVRHTAIDQSYGRLALDPGTGTPGSRQQTDLSCERVHFAGNRGVCLEARRKAVTTYSAILFDARLQPTKTMPLNGIPSRARVSPDGRYVAITVFLAGHSYSGTDFSTETQIIDSVTGAPIVANLEQMEVWSPEGRLISADFNFWGVTFANDPDHFYATLGTGGVAYLVKGDIAANRVTIVKPGVECPSLSPDNTRLAFKKRLPGSGLAKWQLYVLDLTSLKENPVAESRSIDEQVEWLDNGHILYTQVADDAPSPAVSDVWVVPSDGRGQAALLMHEAASPTVLRRGASIAATR